MSKLPARAGWSQADYDDFRARSKGSHTVRWSASAYRLNSSGGVDTLMDDVPITGGQLVLDSSDPIRRKLTLEVGGGDELVPRTYLDPLVPFGQWLVVWVQVDRSDGTWFSKIKQGEYPITSYVFERPSMVATVEATDWSGRVDEFLHLGKHAYKGMTVESAVSEMVTKALPNKVYSVKAGAGSAQAVKNYVAEAGTGRWEAAAHLCDIKGVEVFFDANGDLVIRDTITDYNDDALPSVGPDIGTVSSPVETIAEGSNLVGLTSSLTREGGCNLVRYNLSGTVTRRKKKQDKKKKGVETEKVDWSDYVYAEQTTGSVKWGDIFGYLPIVEDRNLHSVEAGEKASYQRAANHRLNRRRGIIRYIDLDMVGGYHLEPDDKVNLTFGGVTEAHYVQSVTFDLTGQSATRIRTRSLAVTDPGA